MIHSFMGNDHVFWLVVNGLGMGSASPRSYGVEMGPRMLSHCLLYEGVLCEGVIYYILE